MVNETMVENFYTTAEYIINEKIKRIQELETINAELLGALQEYHLTPPDKRAEPAWHTSWYERMTAAIANAKGAAR